VSTIITQDQLKLGGVIMTGLILCNRCGKKMDGVCKCGNYKCLVQIYWKGKYYEYRRDEQGPETVSAAVSTIFVPMPLPTTVLP
jgi:hypothetical protein